ncbi:MAG: ParB/RepB/Spo0J family partition protein [Castellaniella sp.]|uniref:ParB/RepB/Spo0J family partition protein n=1 Tax=Castellaniella sp. TaxID=1955812 RepID=UPI00120C39B3|nr:ParB/RepB/Spo0J family partition protein [Castellaniella sp.]TAN29496.1 MAG: ParB/RepB/Spo0J family partition protein [Castellaniella sp.]
MATRKKGLGRGLDALLGADSDALAAVGSRRVDAPSQLPVSALSAGRYQPRTHMDETALNELADSIRTQGIMQPILVRPLPDAAPGQYEIIAGERRFRAAQLAGLDHVPVLVREVADENAAVMALIENIQREDLNPLEEAQGVRRLLDEFGLTHEQAATAIGRSRSTTTNLLRLLNLAEPVQTMLLAGDIDMGHARALLATDAALQIILANEVVARRLSVRETEKRVARALREQDEALAAPTGRAARAAKSAGNGDLLRLEKALSDHLATKVRIRTGARKGGQLVIDFTSWDHLDALLERQGLGDILARQDSAA